MGISIKGILGTIAPTIASLLPGPLGQMAKVAVTNLLGINPESTQDQIEKALATANPDMLLKLKELDADFRLKMEQLGVDYEKLASEDRASARAMQVALKQKTPAVLATIFVALYGGLLTFLLTEPIPQANHDIIISAIGILSGAVVTILSFYFGSSSGSRAKDDTISSLSQP